MHLMETFHGRLLRLPWTTWSRVPVHVQASRTYGFSDNNPKTCPHHYHHQNCHYRCVNKRIDTAVMQRSACILNNVHNIIITDPWPDRITFLIIDFRWVTRIDLEPRARKWNHPAPLAATNRTEPRTVPKCNIYAVMVIIMSGRHVVFEFVSEARPKVYVLSSTHNVIMTRLARASSLLYHYFGDAYHHTEPFEKSRNRCVENHFRIIIRCHVIINGLHCTPAV